MEMTFEIDHTPESYVMMELFNHSLQEVLQYFVNNVSIQNYKTTKEENVKHATFAFYKLVEAHKLDELRGD
ncbi:hypothetical protein SAMN05421788_11674 [Filimonas lacunae]|uniref:Uncharacterized protein n=1 Tax=Filimonas lacunae TaxID=477680 RepID=A0A173MGU9_9BACT|nr:hypothetical protein [Filimonas lacunae]BAV06719.1 hypothetical protein FLA_2739 [Filimonas lacunae]SIT34465.1 hypothetical protein SAMN05421788_11674 [Filimonas lacunae]